MIGPILLANPLSPPGSCGKPVFGYTMKVCVIVSKIKTKIVKLRPVVAQVYDCNRDWLWVRSPLEEMKYSFKFIFSCPRSL